MVAEFPCAARPLRSYLVGAPPPALLQVTNRLWNRVSACTTPLSGMGIQMTARWARMVPEGAPAVGTERATGRQLHTCSAIYHKVGYRKQQRHLTRRQNAT